jgi:hypothetical protein
MCAQCMSTAMAAVGTASGLRAFVASRRFSWLSPGRMRALTIALAIGAVITSATLVSGTG